jgi:hypothetical protein
MQKKKGHIIYANKEAKDYKAKHGCYPYPDEEYYTCTWNGDKVDLKLHPILHLHQDHHSTFERLVKSGTLNVELIDFLQQEILERRQPPMLKAQEKENN